MSVNLHMGNGHKTELCVFVFDNVQHSIDDLFFFGKCLPVSSKIIQVDLERDLDQD
jgi:hypothetical protein